MRPSLLKLLSPRESTRDREHDCELIKFKIQFNWEHCRWRPEVLRRLLRSPSHDIRNSFFKDIIRGKIANVRERCLRAVGKRKGMRCTVAARSFALTPVAF